MIRCGLIFLAITLLSFTLVTREHGSFLAVLIAVCYAFDSLLIKFSVKRNFAHVGTCSCNKALQPSKCLHVLGLVTQGSERECFSCSVCYASANLLTEIDVSRFTDG